MKKLALAAIAATVLGWALQASAQTAEKFWPATTTPSVITENDPNAVELGVQFSSDAQGEVTGVSFYKGPKNTGKHYGHLWTAAGALLATVTFTNETASGWQSANFSTPVQIAAGTTYIASYDDPKGEYSDTVPYFTSPYTVQDLTAPVAGGVYNYCGGPGCFPNQAWNDSNYYVTPIFFLGHGVSPQSIIGISPSAASYTSGATSGTVIAPISVSMSPVSPAFSGSLTLTGTASADFAISGSNLVTNSSTPTCSSSTVLNINIVATQSSASGSPFTQPVTVTCNPASGSDPDAALLPPDRDFYNNWKMAGLLSVGGIPNRTTQCGSTLSPIGGGSDDTANIQNAINACAVGDFVSLNSGTFTIAEGHTIDINKGVVLRGAGAGATIVEHPPGADTTNDVCNSPGAWGATLGSDCPGNSASTVVVLGGAGSIAATPTLTSDGTAGSYSVSVSSATGISVGSLVLIDELANGQSMPDCCFNSGTGDVWAEPDYRVEWNAHNPAVGSFDSANFSNSFAGNGDACDYSFRCGGVQEELHLVTAVNGNTITFDSPLTLAYRVANDAELWVYTNSSSNVVQDAGIENLTVQYGDQGNVTFSACVYCWAKNVESTIWLNNGGFAFFGGAFRDQIDTFWSHNAAWPVNGGGGYSINLTFGASEDYIVNGISMLANKVDVVRASGAGTVFAYNYMDDGYIWDSLGWIETGINCSHLVGSHGCLFEGNYTFNSDSDFTHGSSTHSTYFRNWMTGFRAPFKPLEETSVVDDSTGCCGPQRAIGDHAYSYWESFIGNVAGKPGLVSSWNYRCAAGNADSGCSPALFNLGWNDTSVSGSLADGSMELSYPTVPTGANATITGSGCVSSGSNCVPIVDGNYDYKTNAIQWASNDTAHIMPPSFYLTSKPAFFNAGSGYTWPWVVPEGGTQIYANPAQARWAACQPTPTASCIMTQP